MRLLERGLRPDQAEPGGDAVDVGVDRQLGPVVGEQQHAGGRLAADAGQGLEELDRPLARGVLEPVEHVEARPARLLDHAEDLLDPLRLDLRDPAGPDRLLDLLDGGGGDGRPSSGSARAAGRRRRRGCGRWCSGRGSSARARRAARGGEGCGAGRSSREAGRGSSAAGGGRAASSAPGRAFAGTAEKLLAGADRQAEARPISCRQWSEHEVLRSSGRAGCPRLPSAPCWR